VIVGKEAVDRRSFFTSKERHLQKGQSLEKEKGKNKIK
jgi:hypothetical protein